MFYVFREIASDKLIVKVERAKGELRLFEGLYQDEILVPFPASLIKDENEKKAVLTYLACGDACGYMDVAIKTMLGGISSRLSEISIKPRIKNPLKLRMFDALKEDRNDYQHEALVVRLKDGSSFVVDLAGPQFGYHLPVMSYDNYIKTMVRDKSSPTKQPFGYQRAEMVKGCSTKLYLAPRYSSNTDIRIFTEQLYRIFNDCLESWQSRKMPLTAMLKLKEKEYLEYQKDLLATVKQVLLDGRSRIETFSNGVPKSPSRIPVPPKTKERTFEEHKAELLRSALANGHAVWDLSGLKF